MRQLLLGWIANIGKVVMITLVFSVAAVAAPAGVAASGSSPTGSTGSDFNHMSTGFPLLGGHATASCETCHVGGVFKGTPKNCDDCHALGKRIVATPKTSNHIVTNAPCESCHFNTSTWLGARFNHVAAKPEQCQTCHNGRIAEGKSASHNSGKKATDSCDHCHRTSAFLPASWNHVGVIPGSCKNAGCHDSSNLYNTSAAIRDTGKTHNNFTYTLSQSCDVCHSVSAWRPTRHMPLAGTCSSCHNGAGAEGKIVGHIATSDECNQCHYSTIAWSPALGAKPANHIPYNAGVQCTSCHTAAWRVVTGAALHANVSTLACKTCHLSGTSYLGSMDKKGIGHEGMGAGDDCSQSGCHKPLGSRGTAYIVWD